MANLGAGSPIGKTLKIVIISVLKIGSNRPIRPVEPRTGRESGPATKQKSDCLKTGQRW